MSKTFTYAPAAILLVGCAFIRQTHSQREVPLVAPLSTILPSVPGYAVEDMKVSDEERAVAGMSDYVARMYARDSVVAFTTLVSYYTRQSQGKTIHSPRNCLPGAGWEIMRSGTRALTVGGVQHIVNQYVLKKGPATALAYYWYQGRGRIVANEYLVKWNLLRDAALSGHTEEALVRVVVPVAAATGAAADSNAADKAYTRAMALGDSVATKMMTEVTRVLPGKRDVAPAS